MKDTTLWEENDSTERLMKSESNQTFAQNDGIKETKSVSAENVCEDTGSKNVWKRNCPKCGKPLFYKTLSILNRFIKLNKDCKECAHKGHHSEKENYVGKRLGILTILRQFKGKKNRTYVECLCDCGNKSTMLLTYVKGNGLVGCKKCQATRAGIKHTNSKQKGEASFNSLYHVYIGNAKSRSLEFSLSKEDLKKLFGGNCFYCGRKPTQIRQVSGSHTRFEYNGVDRKDNNVGYTINNCVSCCKKCNEAKTDMTLSDFISWIRQMYETTKGINIT